MKIITNKLQENILPETIINLERQLQELRTKQFFTSDALKLTANQISASADLSLTTSLQTVPGTSYSFDPAIGATARVMVILYATLSVNGLLGGVATCEFQVDGTKQHTYDFVEIEDNINQSVLKMLTITLTSGTSHTLRLQAKSVPTGGTAYQISTGYVYWLLRNV